MAGRVGGTPVISMNGNRWVGPGHNTVFVDFSGQWWTIYHAVDRHDPYFTGAVGFTKRRQELTTADGPPRASRPVLDGYSLPFVDQMVSLTATATVVSYAIYAIDSPLVRWAITSRGEPAAR